MSLILLLFYVLVKPTQHCTRQVCSKTICQPSLVTRSLAFDTELGVLSWLSILERGTAGSRNSRQMLDSRLAKTLRQTFTYLFFSPGFPLGICHSEDMSYTGRQILDSFVPHQLCWCCTSCLNSLRPLWTHETPPWQGFVIFKWSLKDACVWVICHVKMVFNLNCLNR